jgi:hypothetical protein
MEVKAWQSVLTCDVVAVEINDDFNNEITEVQTSGTSVDMSYVAHVMFNAYNKTNFALNTFPKYGLTNFFPYMSALSFNYVNITSLNGEELINYDFVQYFTFSNSNLNFIHGNLFRPTPAMYMVDFSNNKITKVGAGLFNDVWNYIFEIHFENNICVNDGGISTNYNPPDSTDPPSFHLDVLNFLNNCSCVSRVNAGGTSTCGEFKSIQKKCFFILYF